jgi:predicted nucleic acid-binding Zn finger protein
MKAKKLALAIRLRWNRAKSVAETYLFLKDGKNGYRVIGGAKEYFLSVEDGGRCTCPDYRLKGSRLGFPCKHILAARKLGLIPMPKSKS